MGNVRQTTLILGEGSTEFFFLNSLKDDYSELKSVKLSSFLSLIPYIRILRRKAAV
jgi:hypothetical protein